MHRFRVEVLAKTPNPQQVIYAAMHQDYTEAFVYDERDRFPSEEKCGEIIVKRLLAGDRGHFGCTEHPQIVFNCGYFPHSVMQQARTHRVGLCLSGDTVVNFSHDSLGNGETFYTKTIKELAELWHSGRSHQKSEADAAYMRKMIASRKLLQGDENSLSLRSTNIRNIYINGEKNVYKVILSNGKSIKASEDHLFFTLEGWKKLKDFSNQEYVYSVEYSGSNPSIRVSLFSEEEIELEEWKQIPGYSYYEVSSLGRVRSWMPKKHRGKRVVPQTPRMKSLSGYGKTKYLFTSISHEEGSNSFKRDNVHVLVLKAFKGSPLPGQVARHLDGNSYNNRLSNLTWGTEKENAEDRIKHNTQHKNRLVPQEVILVTPVGVEMTYDIEVDGEFHNFVANGMIVHNSFDVQSYRYTGIQVIDVVDGKKDIEDVFYLRPVGNYSDRTGKKYYYSPEQRESDLQWCLEASKRYKADFEAGMSEEHARGKVPFDYRQHFVVSFNLRSLLHFLDLRYKKDAQLEIQKLCEMMFPHMEEWTPAIAAWYKSTRLGKARLSP
jgi:thymidylate synthase (FAD)